MSVMLAGPEEGKNGRDAKNGKDRGRCEDRVRMWIVDLLMVDGGREDGQPRGSSHPSHSTGHEPSVRLFCEFRL